MVGEQVEKAINLYRQFAKFPQAVSATVSQSVNESYDVIDTVQTQRDLERAEKITFSRSYFVQSCDDGKFKVLYRTKAEELSNVIWAKESKSGRYRAVVRKVMNKKKDEKQFIEVWEGNMKIENFDMSKTEKHGKIYDPDVFFGSLEWSNNEDKLLYVAEKKYKKAVSYFIKPSEEGKSTAETEPGEEFVVKEEWGEGFVGKHVPVLCVLTVTTGEITVLQGVPDNVSAGLGRWLPGDEKILFTGFDHEPYRLGIFYCPIRKSMLYILDVNTGNCIPVTTSTPDIVEPMPNALYHCHFAEEPASITPPERASKCSILSPDQKQFVFVDTNNVGPHMQCSRLLKYDLEAQTTTVIIEEISSVKDQEFPGIYCIALPSQCWAEDGKRVIMNSLWKCQTTAIVINTETKHICKLPSDCGGDISMLSIVRDLIIAQCASPKHPHYLVVGKLPSTGKEATIVWTRLEENIVVLDKISWKVITHVPKPDRVNSTYPSLQYESILLYPTATGNDEKKNLVVFPHGGPHSVFTTDFMLYGSLLCELGFSMLMVNYRGSVGYGMDFVNSLPGNIGDQDVKDVQDAAEEVIANEGYDRDRMCVMGGSHGGFLTCHLVGQYPGFYKAAVCRNPVIDLTSMFSATDTPDWVFAEACLQFDFKSLPDAALCEKMWKCSPVRYVDQISCPVMLLVGKDDKRVPNKQSYQLYKALKARNKPVRFIAYPENGHPIVKVDSEADAFINMYKWFCEHLPE